MGDRMCESVLEDEIFLRTLLLEDAVPMLEWMKNPSVCEKMQFNFANQTLENCQDVIRKSWSDETNVHFAITNNKN